jgi:hypothetical protein
MKRNQEKLMEEDGFKIIKKNKKFKKNDNNNEVNNNNNDDNIIIEMNQNNNYNFNEIKNNNNNNNYKNRKIIKFKYQENNKIIKEKINNNDKIIKKIEINSNNTEELFLFLLKYLPPDLKKIVCYGIGDFFNSNISLIQLTLLIQLKVYIFLKN